MAQQLTSQTLPVGYLASKTLYVIIEKFPNMLVYNPTDKNFNKVGEIVAADAAILMTESSVASGSYHITNLGLPDGDYVCSVYSKLGGSYAPATDTRIQTIQIAARSGCFIF